MHTLLATKADLPAIQHLFRMYGSRLVVGPEHFNKRDIAIQARTDSGELVGFIWCGLMAKNTVGYVDKLAVNPEYAHCGVGHQLALKLQAEAFKRGVRSVFGLIKHDEFHDRAGINALRVAMGSHDAPYTLVETDVLHSIQELKALKR